MMSRFVLALALFSVAAWPQSPNQPKPASIRAAAQDPATPRDFLGYLQGLGPLIAAAVAIGVASTQYYVQRQQMKQALFDKRFEDYTAVEAYLVAVTTGGDRETLFRRFDLARRHLKLLFGPEVGRFVDDFLDLDRERSCHREGDDPWCEATLELTRRVTDEVEPVFRPYLQLHTAESWFSRLASRINSWVDSEQPAVLATRYGKGAGGLD